MLTSRLTVGLTLLLLGSAGLAKDHPIRLTIAPGKVAEVCMPLSVGDTLRWRFKANAPLDFNIHHHVGKDVMMPVDRRAVQVDKAELAIDQSNEWCLMWTAPATAKRTTVEGVWSSQPAK